MRNLFIYVVTLLILLVLQVAVLPPVLSGLPVPNLLLIFALLLAAADENILFFGFNVDENFVIIFAFIAGFLLDIFSSVAFGTFLITFLSASLIVRLVSRTLIEAGFNYRNLLLVSVLVGIASPFTLSIIIGRVETVAYYINSLIFSFVLVLIFSRILSVRA